MKKFLNWLMFLLGFGGEVRNKYVENGLLDHSGQGRDKYGN